MKSYLSHILFVLPSQIQQCQEINHQQRSNSAIHGCILWVKLPPNGVKVDLVWRDVEGCSKHCTRWIRASANRLIKGRNIQHLYQAISFSKSSKKKNPRVFELTSFTCLSVLLKIIEQCIRNLAAIVRPLVCCFIIRSTTRCNNCHTKICFMGIK